MKRQVPARIAPIVPTPQSAPVVTPAPGPLTLTSKATTTSPAPDTAHMVTAQVAALRTGQNPVTNKRQPAKKRIIDERFYNRPNSTAVAEAVPGLQLHTLPKRGPGRPPGTKATDQSSATRSTEHAHVTSGREDAAEITQDFRPSTTRAGTVVEDLTILPGAPVQPVPLPTKPAAAARRTTLPVPTAQVAPPATAQGQLLPRARTEAAQPQATIAASAAVPVGTAASAPPRFLKRKFAGAPVAPPRSSVVWDD
jgi:hypothetical protein